MKCIKSPADAKLQKDVSLNLGPETLGLAHKVGPGPRLVPGLEAQHPEHTRTNELHGVLCLHRSSPPKPRQLPPDPPAPPRPHLRPPPVLSLRPAGADPGATPPPGAMTSAHSKLYSGEPRPTLAFRCSAGTASL